MITSIHTICGFLSLFLGAFALLSPKKTKQHAVFGWLYCFMLIALNVTAFGIYKQFRALGIFHFFALVSLLTVLSGMASILMKERFSNWLKVHYHFMTWSYAGLLAATSNEAFLHIPLLKRITQSTTSLLPLLVMFGILFVSALIISKCEKVTLNKYSLSRDESPL